MKLGILLFLILLCAARCSTFDSESKSDSRTLGEGEDEWILSKAVGVDVESRASASGDCMSICQKNSMTAINAGKTGRTICRHKKNVRYFGYQLETRPDKCYYMNRDKQTTYTTSFYCHCANTSSFKFSWANSKCPVGWKQTNSTLCRMRNSQDSDYIPGGLYLTSTGKECLAPYAKPNKMKTFQVLCYQSIGGSGGDTLQPTPPSEEIKYILQVITGNTYFLDLSAPDMGDVIQARVIDGTGQVVSSNVQFKSYDPSLVNVAEDGALSPVSSSVGSTIVEISYPQANSVNVSVAVGQLTVGTRYLSQTVVQSWDATTGELSVANTAETTDIQIGKVILQLRYGIMAKVNEIEEREDGIVYKTVPASLVETYETLKAEVVVPMPSYPKRKAARSISDFLSDLECESEASFPGVSLSDAHAEAINDVQLIAKIDLGFFKVNSFSLVAEARAGIKADTGSITLSSSSNSKLNCKTNLDKYEIGELSLPIPGTIIFIGPQITPVLGLEASAEFNGPSLTYKGPSFEEGYVVTAGIEYTHSGGFKPVSSEERFGSGLQWGSFSSALTVGFKSMMEIFAGFKFGAFAGVGCCSLTCKLEYPKLCISLTDFDFALARVGAGTELGISSPLSKLSYGYTGPEWGVYVRLYLGADPLLEHLEQFGKLLERIGIDQVNIEFDPKFFDERKYIYESPKPKVTFVSATPDGSWQVSVETGGTTSSRGEVLAFLNTNSDGQSVGQGMLQDGKGTIKIQGLKFGTYELKAETESFFGPSFPYSSNRSHQILAAPPDTGDGDGGSGDPGTGGDGGTGDDGGSGDPGTGGDGDTQSPNVNAECAQESPYYMSYDYSTTDAIFNACVALWNVDPTLLNDAGIGGEITCRSDSHELGVGKWVGPPRIPVCDDIEKAAASLNTGDLKLSPGCGLYFWCTDPELGKSDIQWVMNLQQTYDF